MTYYTSPTPCPPQHAPCRAGAEPPDWQAWLAAARKVRMTATEAAVAALVQSVYCYPFGTVVRPL